jgi:hypothetical protein
MSRMRYGKTPATRGILYGEAPFGWRLSKDRSHLVTDGSEQRIIAVVRHMYLVERIPMREIVRRLDEMGIQNRRGKAFGLSRVWEMIYQGDKPPPEASPTKKRAGPALRKRRGR